MNEEGGGHPSQEREERRVRYLEWITVSTGYPRPLCYDLSRMSRAYSLSEQWRVGRGPGR